MQILEEQSCWFGEFQTAEMTEPKFETHWDIEELAFIPETKPCTEDKTEVSHHWGFYIHTCLLRLPSESVRVADHFAQGWYFIMHTNISINSSFDSTVTQIICKVRWKNVLKWDLAHQNFPWIPAATRENIFKPGTDYEGKSFDSSSGKERFTADGKMQQITREHTIRQWQISAASLMEVPRCELDFE